MAASKIPQDVRVANKNIREAMDIYRNLDRDDPIIWLRLKDINDKLRFGNINPETYNPWEDDFLAPQTKNDIANDIKRLWGSNQEGGQLVDGELAAQNYLYIVDHTSEGAALAGGISGFKGSNRRSPPQQPIKPQGISKGSNIKEIKVNWGQATTFINDRFEALQKSVGQLPKNKLAYDGPNVNYKSSTQKPLEPTKNQIEVRKYYPGTEPENSASGSASGKNKNSSGNGTGKDASASLAQRQKEIIKSFNHLSEFEKNTLMQRAREGVISPEKWKGNISGVKEFKNADEFKIADKWLQGGKNVEKLADVKGTDGNLIPGADFNVNGLIVEAKTANSKNINTTSKKAVEAINRQGENVVIDGRKIGYTTEDAKQIIEIINRKTGGKGNVEIWLNDGSDIKNK
ncbi:hypothetical protein [Paenibacillus popilliae]|uniref:tRNA nuclease CdiA C-terminal domain-containing protein n=1 Tax=Paenibacillus popilliae TaxID=78057 RepID=A0ABY3AJX1_PAEPP|nr:hypothetical protein [Paenibacillus sp. SDF0028]TQR42777.1 hypothetical protein C7Y44_22425 [Paenibacillus sp. SDF0028]